MWRELLRKWFGLSEPHCETCDVLRSSLEKSDMERRELLQRLLESKDKTEPLSEQKEPPIPITPNFTPWRVRQQMLEAEDRRKAQITKERAKEIENLEKELEITNG